MSKGGLKKKSHWTHRVRECAVVRNAEGQLGFELKGGAENGQWPTRAAGSWCPRSCCWR
ncbi:Membrane-associated guanylate kinase, WW and PDZ domain-containing protein 2, partial [Ophiophagus hannah]